jgi:hypothetical protein
LLLLLYYTALYSGVVYCTALYCTVAMSLVASCYALVVYNGPQSTVPLCAAGTPLTPLTPLNFFYLKVFAMTGWYPCVKQALIDRGWHFNPDPVSPYFDLKWTLRSVDVAQESLLPNQLTNHFLKNVAITTKVNFLTWLLSSLFLYYYNSLFIQKKKSFDFYQHKLGLELFCLSCLIEEEIHKEI